MSQTGKILVYSSVGVMVVALAFNIAATAGNGWVRVDLDGSDFYSELGLWKTCVHYGGQVQCADTQCAPSDSSDKADRMCTDLKIVRGTIIAATIDAFFAILFIGYAVYTRNTSRRAIFYTILAAVLGFVAMCAAADFMVQLKSAIDASGGSVSPTPYWCFGLSVVAWIGCIVATVLFIIGSPSLGESTSTMPNMGQSAFQPLAGGA